MREVSFELISLLTKMKTQKKQVINKTHIKTIISLFITNVLPVFTCLYILSYWVLPREWDENNELDGSWSYALGKFRSLNLALGKDSWFTYGPVSHWFGPPMGIEHYQPLPYYVIGAFVAVLFFICMRKIFKNAESELSIKIIAFFIFLFSLTFAANNLDYYMVLVTLLTFTTGYFFEQSRKWWLYCLMILSIMGLLSKILFGILSTLCFVIALVYFSVSRYVTVRQMLSIVSVYLLLMFTLFVVTSGSFNIIRYFVLGLEVSEKYSEIMVYNMFPLYIYGYGILFAAGGLVIGLIAISKMPKYTARAFLISLLASVFLLFKHGHVRADHVRVFYISLVPFFVLLSMIAYSVYRSNPSRVKVVALLLCTCIIVSYPIMVPLMHKDGFNLVTNSWKTIGERFKAGFRGQNPEDFTRKVAKLKSRHKQLFAFLTQQARLRGETGEKTSITFYPWEMMFAEAVEGAILMPSPGFQLYTTGPHSKIHQLEADFLATKTRPDILVIGSRAIDGRNSVSEYTDILPSLYNNYRISAVIEDYVVLESSAISNNGSTSIVCSDTSRGFQGEFLQLKLQPLGTQYEVLWKIATILFKSPELTVKIKGKNQLNKDMEFSFRGYLTQLKKGVYVYHGTIGDLILTNFKRTEIMDYLLKDKKSPYKPPELITEATATVVRNDGLWNLPVTPRLMPLHVEFCSFKKM